MNEVVPLDKRILHIAFVNATSKWGGVKTWMIHFASELAARGHCIRVYGRQQAFVNVAQQRVGHGEQMTFGADCNPLTVFQFIQRFRKDKIDLVVVNVGKDLSTAGIAARCLGLPVVQRIGLPNDIPLRLKTRALHAWIQPYFLAPCQFIAQGFATSLPYLDVDKITVVLNAKKATTHKLETHRPRKLLMTQQLNPDKEHTTVLQALAKLSQDVTPWHLDVVGTGNNETALKQLCTTLGLDAHVTWHGFQTDLTPLLQEADIFLLASSAEGLPNTLLEALAYGLLCISRDVGGVCEVFPEHLQPWLLPFSADSITFCDALERVLQLSDNELLQYRLQTQHAATTTLNLERRVEELETWFKHVINDFKQ